MHYVVTGSLGHTGKPITEGLLKAGHTVTVITSKAETAAKIEALGATAAVGNLEDDAFVTGAFANADAVYLMIPPKWDMPNWRAYQNKVADHYIAAIRANDIRFVVLLSSVGAHKGSGTGPVDGLYDMEQKLKTVEGLNVKVLRPSYFMQNLFSMAGMVKGMGIMGSNFGDGPVVLVHTDDIAEAALQELLNLDFTGIQVRYVAGDERTGAEIARVLGEAVGKPETPWVVFSDEQNKQGMLQAGLSEEVATNYTEMGASMRDGSMQADYLANRPALSKTKLEDFAKNEFAPAFNA
ncbi:NmrA family protein [Fibrella aestuarina BUZ 2]|uniref:NmrA family protein n=1 Tax=Fibrella aestuarina BUZ 2 TaxID=1166018 RepID=I0K8Z2_9BACT|nr:NAD(P)H-binding protein [Fibrella aestuarina]CCH00595.1 NmrA family protein [Fibrella aestuarina BUZ 2]